MKRVVVFDYGFGNVRSMMRALEHVGAQVELTADPQLSFEADGLVVPGVGAFGACMQGIEAAHGAQIINRRLQAERPVFGVCVGQQIMFTSGSEHGMAVPGLGLVRGTVEALDAPRVPHMGWDTVQAAPDSTLLAGVEDERFYFVHSYAAMNAESATDALHGEPLKVTRCNYAGNDFVAALEQGPLSATQFHPEKSGDAGAVLLRNWLNTL